MTPPAPFTSPTSRSHAERTAGIVAAGRRALEEVARRAERFGTPVATMKDGKPAQVSPAEFRRMMNLPR